MPKFFRRYFFVICYLVCDLMQSKANQAPISETNLSPLTDLSTLICSKLSPLFSVDFTDILRLGKSNYAF